MQLDLGPPACSTGQISYRYAEAAAFLFPLVQDLLLTVRTGPGRCIPQKANDTINAVLEAPTYHNQSGITEYAAGTEALLSGLHSCGARPLDREPPCSSTMEGEGQANFRRHLRRGLSGLFRLLQLLLQLLLLLDQLPEAQVGLVRPGEARRPDLLCSALGSRLRFVPRRCVVTRKGVLAPLSRYLNKATLLRTARSRSARSSAFSSWQIKAPATARARNSCQARAHSDGLLPLPSAARPPAVALWL